MASKSKKRAPSRASSRASPFQTLWASYSPTLRNLVLLGAGVTATLALLGILGSLADGVAKLRESGPLPYAGRTEVQKTKEELSAAFEQVLSNFKSLDAAQKALNAESARRNIRGLQTALETAKLKAAESKLLSDQMVVDTLQAQLETALDEAADAAAAK